jgi:hypothetical protein
MNRLEWPLFWVLVALLLFLAACTRAGTEAPPAPRAAVPPPAADTSWQAAGGAELLKGIAILGDSFYDEYQGADGRGGDYREVTFNLVELLVRNRGLPLGAWGDWGEPRRVGYEYNWARSGATSATMIEMGQHLGAAEQVAAGRVSFVFIGIGANDFNPYYLDDFKQIYDGTMSDAALEEKIAQAVANVTLAVETVQGAGAEGVAITLFTQWGFDPTLAGEYPDAARRARVAGAIDAVNARLLAMAAAHGVIVVNQNEFGQTLLPRLDGEGFMPVGGERIDFLHHGDEPHHSRLADTQHVGTVISGLLANYYFVDTLNRHVGLAIQPLTEEEILREAGLRP